MYNKYLQDERNHIFTGDIVFNNLKTIPSVTHLGIDENGFLVKTDSGGSGGGAVDSVNGQTGEVVLTAEDVNAATEQDITDAISDLNLGTASQADIGDFATAAQGLLADTAVQSGDLSEVAISGDYSDLNGIPSTFTPSAHTHAASDVTSGTFDAAQIPNLNASKINAGTLADARIPSLAISKTTGLQAALDAKVGSEQESGVGILISNIIQVTQAQYDGLTPQAGTFYAIVG